MPLNKTVMGLRSMVKSEMNLSPLATLPVSQRLKRQVQILWKLHRFDSMQLTRMGDIAGSRAILPSRAEVDGVVKRIRNNWDLLGDVRDFRDEGAPSGYRAVHIIVKRDERLVEVQLRTPRQHEWAVAVERTGIRLGFSLKEGMGPADLREYFRLASLGMYLEDRGESPSTDFTAQFDQARDAVSHYFTGTG